MLLKEIVDARRYAFYDTAADGEEAVTMSCRPLVDTGCVTPEYAEDVIRSVRELGPYIVILPGLAIPHSTEHPEHALSTAVGFVRLKEPVAFPSDHEEDGVQLFFALSAENKEEHLKNMRRLFTILSNEELIEALKGAESPKELLALEEKFLFPQ